MTHDRRTVACEGHGEAYETYVCEHLIAKPKQTWFGAHPIEDDPWPDAWCAKCNEAFAREGEWNDRNEGEAPIKLLCSACYTERRMKSVESLPRAARKRWEAYVADACREASERQDRMIEELDLDGYARWSIDLEKGELAFSDDSRPRLVLDIEAIGSISAVSETWLWAWANFHIPENARLRIGEVREVGEREGFLHLTEAKWSAGEHDGWHMASVAARALGARGLYRMPGERVTTFVAILGVRDDAD